MRTLRMTRFARLIRQDFLSRHLLGLLQVPRLLKEAQRPLVVLGVDLLVVPRLDQRYQGH
ncbi:MAG: hypothetical protein ACXWPI_16635 [Ktedonobacterales bacterium]